MNTHNVNSPKKHNMTDEHYMRRALEEAHAAADRGEVPVGAVVVCRDTIIARGHNLTETLHDVTAHAEMQAVTAAAGQLGGKREARRRARVVANQPRRLRRRRPKTRCQSLRPPSAAPQDASHFGRSRRRMRCTDERFLQTQKISCALSAPKRPHFVPPHTLSHSSTQRNGKSR